MKNGYFFFLCILLISTSISAQIETLEPGNEIYPFLKILSQKGIIKGYDDVVLPLSKAKILKFLDSASHFNDLTRIEKEKIEYEILKLSFPNEVRGSQSFYNIHEFQEKPFYLFLHSDSVFHFQLNPLLGEESIFSFKNKASSHLLNFGFGFTGTYLNKVAFEFRVTNGIQSGNKSLSFINRNVLQSYTFNKTGLNYFDYTEGSIRYEDNVFNAEVGRKRLLWGYGEEKINISANAPIFDFIKMNVDFDFLNVNFLHGWLVQPPDYSYDSSLSTYKKIKNPKYIALCRFGFRPSDFFSFGFTETIIYANRPFEAAYLNPFLFYESAQRSMNDLDNSFLGFDLKIFLHKGLTLSTEFNFDDFNFKNINQNRYIMETDISISNPVLPDNLLLVSGVVKVDPYLFSHIGNGEALTYTNNGYLIGPNLQPNSLELFLLMHYILNKKIYVQAKISHIIHGDNIYDEKGNLSENKGGRIFDYFKPGDNLGVKFLSGDRKTSEHLYFNCSYNIVPSLLLSLNYEMNILEEGTRTIYSELKFDF